MEQGEIWWASLPEPAGSEPGYRRPVVIVQGDAFNRSQIGQYRMESRRPDLSQVDPTVRAYIEALEAEVERLRGDAQSVPEETARETELPLEPPEPPTTLNLITISRDGNLKRTPRHLYNRQRRGGMGIFDLETSEDDPPFALLIADESQCIVVITDRARAFRWPLSALSASPIRSGGQLLSDFLPLEADERPSVFLPPPDRGYLALLTAKGYVLVRPAHLVGEKMTPGLALFKADEYGAPVAACWTPGDGDLFIATRHGQAIRFSEKQAPLAGALGIRLESGDAVAAMTSVKTGSGVFLLGADGKGTIRLMSGFAANQAPGGGGKTALKTGQLSAAVAIKETDDVFIISRLSKIIRFRAGEIPPKDGVVQGVNCMALRADETVAVCASPTA